MIEVLNGMHETVSYAGMNGVKVYHNDEAENYPKHWHTEMEIIMPLESDYSVEIGDYYTDFKKDDLFLIPPGEIHSLYAPPSGERLILLFDYSLICNLSGMDSLMHILHPFKLITKEEYPELNETLRSILLEIEKEYFSKMPFMEASIYSLLIRFFVELGRTSINGTATFPNITSNKQHEYIEKFMTVCKYISDHCAENITADELADIAGFSKFHFARLFKQFAGVTYYDYLTQKRINYAEKLLIAPNTTITEVALQAGFNSLSTFNRLFKASKKCTPTEYRNLNNPRQLD